MRFLGSSLLAVGLIFPSIAKADIYDRIDSCERAGGGACVFSLLRELAQSQGGTTRPDIIPATGLYTQNTNGNFCQTLNVVPVVDSGYLSSLRLGFCNGSYNETLPCSGRTCTGISNKRVEIIDRGTIKYIAGDGQSVIFLAP